MIIRCHGARGSIPVSGKEYIKYGGDTTCIEIRSKSDEIIIVERETTVNNRITILLFSNRALFGYFGSSPWTHRAEVALVTISKYSWGR